jgi:hypothetical protein
MTEQKPRGFAALTPEQRKAIASMGGKAAHRSGNAHQFTTTEARAASYARRDRKQTAALTELIKNGQELESGAES